MEKTLFVIGHRNPDTDSIAAAVAYAELKRQTGAPGAVAAMAGEPNPQTRYILDRLGIPDPVYLADVHPKVRDTLNRAPVTVGMDTCAYQALEAFHGSGVRTLPVLDADGKPWGVLSQLRLSEKYLLPGPEHQREITTTLRALARTLSGTIDDDGAIDAPVTLKLFIGAMGAASFSGRIAGYDPRELLVMTGNRRSIQHAAIERGVRLLVLTGDHAPDDDVVALAAARGTRILLTPHDTATAAWLARLSTPVSLFAERRFETVGVGEPLTRLRRKLLASREPSVLALEEDGTLAGVATKSSLLAPLPYALVLVDHNEFAQAVPGAEAVEIEEVIDHHKLGNGPTVSPIAFVTSPVGSTCTLVANRYLEQGVAPEPKTAALLLAGILSDTVLLKSPTTTDADRAAVARLEGLSGLDAAVFGREIFAATSSIRNHGSAEKALESDFKLFRHGTHEVGIGQVEVIGFDEFLEMKQPLLEALAAVRRRDGLFVAGLMVTDIAAEVTLFLVEGYTRIAHVMEYPQVEPHLYEMKGVLSRKKQLVPHLLKVLSRLEGE
jgi:manganese-dependent inorganic pyrophosphatase